MCEVVYGYRYSADQNQLSNDVINYLKIKGVKVGTVREFLTYLHIKETHFNSFIQLLNEDTKTLTCEFLSRFNKIPPHVTYKLIFNKTISREIPSKVLYQRIIFILNSDIDLLISNLRSRNKEREVHILIEKIHEIFGYSSSVDIQPFFDALGKDVISNLLNNEPEKFILPYINQLQILILRSYLGSNQIKLFGKTVLSASSLYICKFLDSKKLILNNRLNSTLFIEVFAHYFYSKEYTSTVPPLITEVPKFIHSIVLESYLNSDEIEVLIHETSIYLKIMDVHQDYNKLEKVFQISQSYKMSTTDGAVGKSLWTMITNLFLVCDKRDIDWIHTQFDSSITKNFFRKLNQQPKDRIDALANLLKFYYLFNPVNKYWKCKTNEEFFKWLLSQTLSEKLELMIDICGVLATKFQSNHLIGLFIYLALFQKRLYRILLGYCTVYRLQSLNRKTYLSELHLSLYPLIDALRNMTIKLLVKTNSNIVLEDENIQSLLVNGWKFHFEDEVYVSLCKSKDTRLIEAYSNNIQTLVQNKTLTIRDCRHDFYRVEFHDVKYCLETIIKKLLGPIPIIHSKHPRSESCHIQVPDVIDYYYDPKNPHEKNRNILHYKGYIVNEASKYLAHSDFTRSKHIKDLYKFPSLYYRIYDCVEIWRCQNVFFTKYANLYDIEAGYLAAYNKQRVEQFKLDSIIWKNIVGLLSIYSIHNTFPQTLISKPDIRNFLYETDCKTEQTIAELIRSIVDHHFNFDTHSSHALTRSVDSIYKAIVKNVPQSELGTSGNETDKNLTDKVIDTPQNDLDQIYSEYYASLMNRNDALNNALNQLHEHSRYNPTRCDTYSDNSDCLTLNSWHSLHELIDAHKI